VFKKQKQIKRKTQINFWIRRIMKCMDRSDYKQLTLTNKIDKNPSIIRFCLFNNNHKETKWKTGKIEFQDSKRLSRHIDNT